MRLKLVLATLFLAVALSPAPVHALGPYVSAGGSYTVHKDVALPTINLLPPTTVDFTDGYALRAAVGFDLPLFRIEGEFTHLRTKIDTLSNPAVLGGAAQPASGSIDARIGMLNLYFDLPVPFFIGPYVGVGAGVAYVEARNVGAAGITVQNGRAPLLAYQAIAGLAFDILPLVTAYVEYRFIGMGDAGATNIAAEDAKIHSAGVGLRIGF
jgi:opacity protein-like surface antigen